MMAIEVHSNVLSYPVLFFHKERFEVLRSASAVGSFGAGLLVDAEGRCYRVIRVESPFVKDGRVLPRSERRQLRSCDPTLVCEGEPFTASVEDVRQKIVWLVSARGHFESAQGFGLSTSVTAASTVAELIEAVVNSECE